MLLVITFCNQFEKDHLEAVRDVHLTVSKNIKGQMLICIF